MSDAIYLVDYDPRWPELFEAERARLQGAGAGWFANIHHVGSTSVPGLAAKPVIDMLAIVDDSNLLDLTAEVAAVPGQGAAMEAAGHPSHVTMVKAVTALGFTYRGENGLPSRVYFQRRKHGAGAHLHVVARGSWFATEQLAFRDWLRGHRADALAYENLKRDLARRYPNDRVAYTMAKTAFISQVLFKAGVAPRPQ